MLNKVGETKRKEIASEVAEKLREHFRKRNFRVTTPFRALVRTVLSQRTRDENTDKAFEMLFKVVSSPEDILSLPEEKLRELIKSAGFYRVKAKRLKEICKVLVEKYNGEVPEDFDEILSLPGVGRKTANCVLVYGFDKEAIPVDTHVHRISNLIPLVKTKTPEETEMELVKIVPRQYWKEINEHFVRLGQTICKPLKQECEVCPLNSLCQFGKRKMGG
ncbi:MAG TPA: endonuclease III [Thermoplasmata archaeon]|nr:endonuclease III [Thermoplasmata archaeon]